MEKREKINGNTMNADAPRTGTVVTVKQFRQAFEIQNAHKNTLMETWLLWPLSTSSMSKVVPTNYKPSLLYIFMEVLIIHGS